MITWLPLAFATKPKTLLSPLLIVTLPWLFKPALKRRMAWLALMEPVERLVRGVLNSISARLDAPMASIRPELLKLLPLKRKRSPAPARTSPPGWLTTSPTISPSPRTTPLLAIVRPLPSVSPAEFWSWTTEDPVPPPTWSDHADRVAAPETTTLAGTAIVVFIASSGATALFQLLLASQ